MEYLSDNLIRSYCSRCTPELEEYEDIEDALIALDMNSRESYSINDTLFVWLHCSSPIRRSSPIWSPNCADCPSDLTVDLWRRTRQEKQRISLSIPLKIVREYEFGCCSSIWVDCFHQPHQQLFEWRPWSALFANQSRLWWIVHTYFRWYFVMVFFFPLCVMASKMINRACPNTIDERAINKHENMNVFQKTGNLKLALNAASSIGCVIINIGWNDLLEATVCASLIFVMVDSIAPSRSGSHLADYQGRIIVWHWYWNHAQLGSSLWGCRQYRLEQDPSSRDLAEMVQLSLKSCWMFEKSFELWKGYSSMFPPFDLIN